MLIRFLRYDTTRNLNNLFLSYIFTAVNDLTKMEYWLCELDFVIKATLMVYLDDRIEIDREIKKDK